MKELYCQSCGMPLEKQEDFGTNADGTQNKEYCSYCFQHGSYAQPDITMEQMMDLSAPGMAEAIPEMTIEKAHTFLEEFYPTLKRWKN